ncbi:krab-a domain-containing protein, partial [Lasius niger]
MVSLPRQRIPVENCKLRYPTGEEIEIKFKVNVWISLEKIFESVLGISKQNPFCNLLCSRIECFEKKVPHFFRELFKKYSENLDSSEKEIFAEFLYEFQDVFSENIVAGNCGLIEHEINLTDCRPIKQAPRRIPISMRGEVNKNIEEMKTQGVIEESQSPWVSPAVLFTVMPFGLCNAPATFEKLMERVLQKLLSKVWLVYLDDVIIFSKDFKEIIRNLKEVFLRLRTANLKINPKKCVLFGKNVKYLGHVISEKGITTDPEKIIAVKNWPIPQNKKQIRSFLGFCSYYRKFVKGFSSIAKPLYNLTENLSKFEWKTDCQEAFDNLKQALTSSSVLSFPKENGMFILDTDVSNLGIGAVLSQKQNGIEKVIAYYSRTFNKTERNCVTRRELLAVVDSIKSFHHYLYGQSFLVRTDHASLKWLMSFKNLEGQLARWLERLQQYNFEIIYRKGQSHRNADGLSRRPCAEIDCKYCAKVELSDLAEEEKKISRILLEETTSEEWRRDQLEDPNLAIFVKGKEEGRRSLWQEVVARDSSAKVYWSYWDALILKNEAHDSSSGGHFGVNKTLGKIRKRFYWATCKTDVEDWCSTCKICVAKKGPAGKGKSPLQILNVGALFERVEMNVLGPLPKTVSGNRYLLVITDCFTKWVEAIPLKNIRAKQVAEAFVSQIVSRHGVPLELHTDQGRNFESKIFKELINLLGIRKTRTTALHPQSDGQVERQHQTIINYLAKFIAENQKDWDRWIPMYLLAYRTSKHEATGVTSSELYFAQDLRLPLDLLRGCPPELRDENSAGDYVNKLKKKLEEIYVDTRQRLEIKSSRAKS